MIRFAANNRRKVQSALSSQDQTVPSLQNLPLPSSQDQPSPSLKELYDCFSEEKCKIVRKVHEMAPLYQPTQLIGLECLARCLGVRAILLKDESTRFGLKAFKGLGGIYAMFRIICKEFGLDPEKTTLDMLKEPPLNTEIRQMTFATTTDGNHGKGVSWAAGILGCKAYVYMPKGTVPVRAQAIRDAGNADVTITDMGYDDCVAWTAQEARSNGWHLIQDTAWPGYEEIPLWIMQGYSTIYYEALQQMKARGITRPTHLFLQTGVGAMAAAIAASAVCSSEEHLPVIATVDPDEAACFYESFATDDGQLHKAKGSEITMMAGLNCSLPSKTAWEILSDCAIGGFACSDDVTCHGMRRLSAPEGNDPAVVSGESGAVTLGLTELLLSGPECTELKEKLSLDRDSVIFLISTEGDTDPENYRRITEGTK